jgi:hypothetical protein
VTEIMTEELRATRRALAILQRKLMTLSEMAETDGTKDSLQVAALSLSIPIKELAVFCPLPTKGGQQ